MRRRITSGLAGRQGNPYSSPWIEMRPGAFSPKLKGAAHASREILEGRARVRVVTEQNSGRRQNRRDRLILGELMRIPMVAIMDEEIYRSFYRKIGQRSD